MYDDDPHENYLQSRNEKLQEFLEPFECDFEYVLSHIFKYIVVDFIFK